ncbi:MAG: helix-turn-helix domain-containing protein [Oscillospiraceae bacterium]|nr:helix-turn-helix domain-containing protein [Oscillospiraceae bacterium]
MEFKDRIKALRMENNMTQSKLAATLDKSEGAIRAWEIERSKPDVDTLITLAEYFGCTTDYLLGLSDYRSPEEKKEIESMCSALDTIMSEIENGKELLDYQIQFLKVMPRNNRQSIALCFFQTADYLASALRKIYALQDDLSKTKQEFDFSKFLESYCGIFPEVAMTKSNIGSILETLYNLMIDLVIKYGTSDDLGFAGPCCFPYHYLLGADGIPNPNI